MEARLRTGGNKMANRKNYNKISTENAQVVENVEEPQVVEKVEAEPVRHGVVANCAKLNVRTKPNATATVKQVVEVKTKVVILEDANDEFYKVKLSGGVEGYCMKAFIKSK